ncbi:hypothetical protein Peur_009808 [Populus x canadensis]
MALAEGGQDFFLRFEKESCRGGVWCERAGKTAGRTLLEKRERGWQDTTAISYSIRGKSAKKNHTDTSNQNIFHSLSPTTTPPPPPPSPSSSQLSSHFSFLLDPVSLLNLNLTLLLLSDATFLLLTGE